LGGYTVPVVYGSDAPVFTYSIPGVELKVDGPHATVRGYASPSRGSTETCVGRLSIAAGSPPRIGTVDREEIFLLLSGGAHVTLGDEEYDLKEGDALIIPPHVTFGIGNPHDEPLVMMTVLPVGGRGYVPGQNGFIPPWAE
jgi:quercetin dioxygenase-like cupin family protein